jgi:hypothetical protein
MFATLLGPLPRPPLRDDADPADLLYLVLDLQASSGLDPVTSAGWDLDPRDPVGSWQAARDRTDRLVKAVVTGPLSAGADPATIRDVLVALRDAGCTWIEIHEPAAVGIADDEGRRAFADAHRTLTADLDRVHLSLAITGGNADALGVDAILAGSYASLAVDLIDGPDNWRLVAAWPGDRGVIAGALHTRPTTADGPEVLLWAAGYAASTKGRGGDRVGLATAGSMAALPWTTAVDRMRRLGETARLAEASPDAVRDAVDPRALDARSAAMGRYAPPLKRRPGPPRERS